MQESGCAAHCKSGVSPQNATDVLLIAGAASAAEMAAERERASVHTNIEELLQRLNAARLPGSDTAISPPCVYPPPAAKIMGINLPNQFSVTECFKRPLRLSIN